VSEQQNLSSTDGWSPQSLKFSFPKTDGTEDLPLGVRTELLQSLDFSGVFLQSVMQQTQKISGFHGDLWCFIPSLTSTPMMGAIHSITQRKPFPLLLQAMRT